MKICLLAFQIPLSNCLPYTACKRMDGDKGIFATFSNNIIWIDSRKFFIFRKIISVVFVVRFFFCIFLFYFFDFISCGKMENLLLERGGFGYCTQAYIHVKWTISFLLLLWWWFRVAETVVERGRNEHNMTIFSIVEPLYHFFRLFILSFETIIIMAYIYGRF